MMENDGNFVILLLWVINFDKVSSLVEITKNLGGGGARPFGPTPCYCPVEEMRFTAAFLAEGIA